MRKAVLFEGLESRKLMSAVASAAAPVKVIGPTSGVSAQSAQPVFVSVHGTVHASDGTALDDSDTGIDLDSALKIKIAVNDTGTIDNTHLGRPSVIITDIDTNTVLSSTSDLSKVITSGGGDTIIVSLKTRLSRNSHYSIEINAASTPSAYVVRTSDGSGTTNFADTTFDFTTGTYYAVPTVSSKFSAAAAQSNAGNHGFTAVTWGPDGKLYAADTQGYIYSYAVGSDGTLASPTVITTIRDHFGGNRLITGIVFKPNSTATAMELWVSNSQYRFGNNPSGSDDVQKSADNFTGEIDALSGDGLATLQQLVIHIPRSVKDHTNNQIVFSPDGRTAYFGVAAMNAMGAPDSTWGNRPENIYSATIMQLRASGASSVYTYARTNGPVNLLLDGGNNATGADSSTWHYNIFKGSNPLRIYADGIRNDFDMVFATNGHLYAAINGSSSGGNTPATPTDLSTVPTQNRPDKDVNGTTYSGPTAPGLTNVATVEEDTLLDVKNGAYYGHPNATRGEYVLDGGNPTNGVDPYEFAGTGASGSYGYAAGQQPDRNYTDPVYDFGQDYSADGIIQYKSVGSKNADLNNYLLVARYSSGGDIFGLQPLANGSIGKTQANVQGLTNFGTPLDLTEDPNTGNLYVAVLTDETGSGSLQLVKPLTTTAAGGTPSLNKSKLAFYLSPGSSAGTTQSVTLTNSGSGSITIDRSATKISSKLYRKNFLITNLPDDDMVLAAGASYTFTVKGVLAKGQTAAAGVSATPNTVLAIRLLNTSGGNVYATVNLRAFDGTKVATQSYTAPAAASKGLFASASLVTSGVVAQIDPDDLMSVI